MATTPTKQVGILGAGQLGRMLALAGYPLEVRCVLLDPTPESPAAHVAEQLVGEYTDAAALARLAACEVVTYEFENVPASAAAWLAERVPVYPPPPALEVARDRWHEKTRFRELGIPTARFANAESAAELAAALDAIALPALVKTRTLGYDGKGQRVLRDATDPARLWEELGAVPLIVEAFVPFERELSLIAVRSSHGECAYYPLTQNEHRQGILHLSQAPAPNATDALQRLAEDYAGRLLESLAYVGVLALELFEAGGQLVANEMAPRVHNSGHWTIEGAETSQFENHLRAILGLPLGSTKARGFPAMLNLIGTLPERAHVLAVPGAHLHLYGKEPRPGRKLGHVTLSCNTAEQRCERVDALLRAVSS
jgi:5-(carboxyamino)imidazole ribonucleotide synthase